jgi:hypothetical protein
VWLLVVLVEFVVAHAGCPAVTLCECCPALMSLSAAWSAGSMRACGVCVHGGGRAPRTAGSRACSWRPALAVPPGCLVGCGAQILGGGSSLDG